jgi:hypothetical protein
VLAKIGHSSISGRFRRVLAKRAVAGRPSGSFRVQFPKQWLFRPISIAAASCLRVTDGFDKTAETASHFVGAFRRSPAHPVNITANRRIMILIRAIYPY